METASLRQCRFFGQTFSDSPIGTQFTNCYSSDVGLIFSFSNRPMSVSILSAFCNDVSVLSNLHTCKPEMTRKTEIFRLGLFIAPKIVSRRLDNVVLPRKLVLEHVKSFYYYFFY